MLKRVSELAEEFLELSKDKPIRLISHHDTDGITSAAIISQMLKRLDKKFTIKIVKGLDEEILKREIPRAERELLFFTDLASSNLDYFKDIKHPIFILDHHEIKKQKLNENIKIINPHLFNNEEICGAGISYLFAKAISKHNKDLAKLAVIGMVGDRLDSDVSKINQSIIRDAKELTIRKGLLIFSATRPLRRSLQYSTSPYIPGVTGDQRGVIDLLREVGISPEKTISELDDKEMSKLITAIMIRRSAHSQHDGLIGNIYLLKFFERIEDLRELSVLINACSRLGHSDIALSFCLENEKAYATAQDIYIKYKQELISGLQTIEKIEQIKGSGFVILNARDFVKDTIIGTITSIISSSANHEEGTILIGMAYNQDKIKVSARIVGKGRNLKEMLEKTVVNLKAEVGGHQKAAGCLIKKEDEDKFLESLKKTLEIEIVKL